MMVSLGRVLSACLFAGLVAFSLPCLAELPVLDRVVKLKSGAIYRGETLELVPNDHLTIRIASGEIRQFAWDQIEETSELKAVKKTDTASEETESEPSGTNPKKNPHVQFKSDNPNARLYALQLRAVGNADEASGGWRYVCAPPCNMALDSSTQYRIGGEGVMKSEPFRIPETSSLELEANTSSRGTVIAGWILFGVFASTATGGGIALASLSDDVSNKTRLVLGAGTAVSLGISFLGLTAAMQTTTVAVTRSRTAQGLTLPLGAGFALGPSGVTF